MKGLQIICTCFLFCMYQHMYSQSAATQHAVRATTGVSGSSQQVTINNKNYVIQQSIGQAGLIGSRNSNEAAVIQGFLQPYVWNAIVNREHPLDLTARIYPNPFFEKIQAVFSETVKTPIDVEVYDVLGKQVYSRQFKASQKIEVTLSEFSNAVYILKCTANKKQFVKRILKK